MINHVNARNAAETWKWVSSAIALMELRAALLNGLEVYRRAAGSARSGWGMLFDIRWKRFAVRNVVSWSNMRLDRRKPGFFRRASSRSHKNLGFTPEKLAARS